MSAVTDAESMNAVKTIEKQDVVSSTITVVISALVVLWGSPVSSAGIDCSGFDVEDSISTSYKRRPDGLRCEGMLVEKKSLSRDSLFHVRSAVFGRIEYGQDEAQELSALAWLGASNAKGDIEIIGQWLGRGKRYRIFSRLPPQTPLIWSSGEVIKREKLVADKFAIMGRAEKSQFSGSLSIDADEYVYVPMKFSVDGQLSKKQNLRVTVISGISRTDVKVIDHCKRDQPEEVFVDLEVDANNPVSFTLSTTGCNTTNFVVESADDKNENIQIQLFSVLR